MLLRCFFFFSSRRRHTRCSRDWSSDVCSSDLCGQSICTGQHARSPAQSSRRLPERNSSSSPKTFWISAAVPTRKKLLYTAVRFILVRCRSDESGRKDRGVRPFLFLPQTPAGRKYWVEIGSILAKRSEERRV